MPVNETIEFDGPQTHEIIGAAMDVPTEIGSGFLEPVYKWALSIRVEERSIPQAYWQAVHYVRAAKHERGLLLNFGSTSLQYKRCTSTRTWHPRASRRFKD